MVQRFFFLLLYLGEYKLQKYANFIVFNEADGRNSLGLLSKILIFCYFLDFQLLKSDKLKRNLLKVLMTYKVILWL